MSFPTPPHSAESDAANTGAEFDPASAVGAALDAVGRAGGGGGGGEDGILRAIADLQSGLSGLKQIREETARLQEEMAQRRSSMEAWERRLKEKADEIEHERSALKDRQRDLQERDAALTGERRNLDTRAAELAAQQKEQSSRGARLDTRTQELEQRSAELDAERKRLDERGAALESERATLDEMAEALGQRETAMASLAAAVEEQRKELEKRAAALEQQGTELGNRSSGLEARRKELEGRAAELETVRADLDRSREEADERLAELERAREAVREGEEALERARAELEAARGVIASRQAEADAEREQALALRKQAESMRQESIDAAMERSRELTTREAELAAREVRCKQTEREAAEQVAQAMRKKEEAEAGVTRAMERVSVLERELDGLRHGRTSASEIDSSALERARHEAQAANQRAEEAIARAAELEEAMGAAREEAKRELDDLTERITEAAAERSALEARLASMERDLEQASRILDTTKAELDARTGLDTEDISKRDLAIDALRRQLDEAREWGQMLETELESLRQSAGAAGGSVVRVTAAAALGGDAAWVESRRERLTLYKKLLQAQARKIITAKEALTKRRLECDQVLAQRAKLAEAIETLRAREEQLAARRARTGAAATVFYALGSLVIIAALSWTLAAQFIPATYVAVAEIAADVRDHGSAGSEIAGWQQYHNELVADPRMVEAAAERFMRRGMPTLGTPAELADRLKRDLAVSSRQDGSLTVELRGRGMERTQRELDTYVTALASVANATRPSRPDGLATVVAQAAKVNREPVEDPRPVYALGMAGGGALAVGLFGFAIWTRLARSKRRYEEEQRLGEALDDLSWGEGGAAVN